MHKISNFTGIYAVDFRTFKKKKNINQFLSLSACLINEYAMMENKLLGLLRTRIKLTEK